MTLGCSASLLNVAASVAASLAASCGWMPTEHQMSSWLSARLRTTLNSLIFVQIVKNALTPARRARAITSSRSAPKSAKSRWQWLSTSIGSAALPRFFSLFVDNVARENPLRLRQRRPCDQRVAGERREVAAIRCHGQLIQQLRRCFRHDRLDQD